jgi:FkbM family methyltransferase
MHLDKLYSYISKFERGIFIDGGFFKGEVSSYLLPKLPSWQFHAFDINIDVSKVYADQLSSRYDNFHFYNQALYKFDGDIRIYIDQRHDIPNGSNIVGKNFGKTKLDLNSVHMIKCIDLAKWIRTNFRKDDVIVIKLDVEGAEFEILQHMIHSGVIEYVNLLCVEWHHTLNIRNIELDIKKLPETLTWV